MNRVLIVLSLVVLCVSASGQGQDQFSSKSNVGQSGSRAQNPRESDHVRLSTPILKEWRTIPLGSPVYKLVDAAGSEDWLEHSQIQPITVQTGVWHILIERGYSVFRIYPYLSNDNPPPNVHQGIVLRVNGSLSREQLVAAIRKRNPMVKIDEYEIFGADNVRVQRYSRQPQPGR